MMLQTRTHLIAIPRGSYEINFIRKSSKARAHLPTIGSSSNETFIIIIQPINSKLNKFLFCR